MIAKEYTFFEYIDIKYNQRFIITPKQIIIFSPNFIPQTCKEVIVIQKDKTPEEELAGYYSFKEINGNILDFLLISLQ